MRLSSCISLDLLYLHNGDEPSENCSVMNLPVVCTPIIPKGQKFSSFYQDHPIFCPYIKNTVGA